MSGRVFAVAGPSGAGKDTLIEAALPLLPGLRRARRTITRPAAAGGEDFESVSEAEFAAREAAGAFALTWRAHGLRYGIPREIDDWLAGGEDAIFNASRTALAEARGRWPGLVTLLVTAPPAVLAQRLAARGRETPEAVARRLAREAPPPEGARVVEIVNDGPLFAGLARFVAAIRHERGGGGGAG